MVTKMRKRVFRYFFDFLDGQERWLNAMSEKGWRLTKCGRLFYTFEACASGEYEYAVEFVGEQSAAAAKQYRAYLDGLGLRTLAKNVNLNASVGKIRWRPYGRGWGSFATSPGGFNKELLIVEQRGNAGPLRLHTDVGDRRDAYRTVLHAYLWAALLLLGMAAATFLPGVSTLSAAAIRGFRCIFLLLCALYGIPAVKYARAVGRLRRDSELYE